MKSAYELAMERLEKASPAVKLTDEQRSEIAELDSFLGGEIAKAKATGDFTELEALQTQLSRELRRLQNECEERKEQVRARGRR